MDPKTLKGGKPVAAALPGTGAGHRAGDPAVPATALFVADTPKARIGLPEILVGLFPGAGGTTRILRMVGAMGASPVLLEGKLLTREGAGGGPYRRGGGAGRVAGAGEGVGAGGEAEAICEALGPEGLQDAGRRALSPGGVHDLCRRLGDGERQDEGRLPGGEGAAVGGLRRRAGALRHGAEDRGAVVHLRPARPVIVGDDPVACSSTRRRSRRARTGPPCRTRRSGRWACLARA